MAEFVGLVLAVVLVEVRKSYMPEASCKLPWRLCKFHSP